MKFRPAVLAAVGLCLASVATLRAQAQTQEEAKAPSPMATLIDQWESSFNAGDFEATAALYTTDAVRYPPGAPEQDGRDAIAAEMANYAEYAIDLELVGSESSGDVMAAWGTYALHARSGEDMDPIQSGPWMNVAKRQEDGSWLIYRDIWNSREQP